MLVNRCVWDVGFCVLTSTLTLHPTVYLASLLRFAALRCAALRYATLRYACALGQTGGTATTRIQDVQGDLMDMGKGTNKRGVFGTERFWEV